MTETLVTHDVATVAPAHRASLRSRSVSVVIPAYNEEEILHSTVVHVLEGLEGLDLDFSEVILCENGSSDGTLALARELAAEHDQVRVTVIDRPDYGAAMKTGFLLARGDAIVNFDADYYDMEFLSDALRVDGDIVVAAKNVFGSNDARVLSRRIISRSFGWLVRSILDVRVAETHGMKLFHKHAIESILPSVRSTKDLFDTELLARSEWGGLAIRELPVETKELRHSRSGILRRIPRTMWGLVRMRLKLRKAHAARVRVFPDPVVEPSLDVAV